MVAVAPMVDCEFLDACVVDDSWNFSHRSVSCTSLDTTLVPAPVDLAPSAFQPYSSAPAQVISENGSRVVAKLTCGLKQTFRVCNPSLNMLDTAQAPSRKVLTTPSVGVKNEGYDNDKSELIVAVDDMLLNSTTGKGYQVKNMLGQGTFGQVVCCWSEDMKTDVAVKIIKNQPAYFNQARVEIGILQLLNTRCDPDDKRHVVRLYDYFVYRQHLCLVFEKLDINLYELLRHNKHRGLTLRMVRCFLAQVLDAMSLLRDANIIHCDLKPENILLKGRNTMEVKLIDYGSACFENRSVYSYIQSRFYRSPEVVLGLEYNVAIDTWSLGCVAAELFLGIPLFPALSEHDLMVRLVEMLGRPCDWVLQKAKHTDKFFSTSMDENGTIQYTLRNQAEFEAINGVKAPVGKRYFEYSTLHDIVCLYSFKEGASEEEQMEERQDREAFLDFLLGVLDVDPVTRWSPRQAASHPFMTGERFNGPFQPQPDPKHPIVALDAYQNSAMSLPLQFHSPSSVTPPATPSLSSPPWLMGTPGSLPSSQLYGFSPAHAQTQLQAQAHAIAMATLQHMASPKFGSLSATLAAETAWCSMASGLSSLPGSLPSSFPSLPAGLPQQTAVEPCSGEMQSPGLASGSIMNERGMMSAAVPISIPPAAATSLPFLVASVGHQLSFPGLSQHISVGATPSTSYIPSLEARGMFSGVPASPGGFGSVASSLPHSFCNHFGYSPAAWDVHHMAAAAAAAAVAAQQAQQQNMLAHLASTPNLHLQQAQLFASTPSNFAYTPSNFINTPSNFANPLCKAVTNNVTTAATSHFVDATPPISGEQRWQSTSVPQANLCSGSTMQPGFSAATYTSGMPFVPVHSRGCAFNHFDAAVADQSMVEPAGAIASPGETSDVESMSLNPSPGDWDPLYSDDQLLDDGSDVQRHPCQSSASDTFEAPAMLSPNRGAHQMPRSFAVCGTLSSSETGSISGSVATVGSVVSPNAHFGMGFTGFATLDASGGLASPSMPMLKPASSNAAAGSSMLGFNVHNTFTGGMTHMGVSMVQGSGNKQLSLHVDPKVSIKDSMQS